MSKAAKPAASQTTEAAPPKSKKMLIIIITALILLLGGGAAAFLLLKPHAGKHDDAAAEAQPEAAPKFVELGTFTANLIHEDGDRYLQIAISLKLSKPELEEKIKANSPEVLHRVNMLLQSKRPSELATVEGKEKLASDIKAQVEYVIGLRKTAPAISQAQPDAVAGGPVTQAPPAKIGQAGSKSSGISEVLFTSFIIQ